MKRPDSSKANDTSRCRSLIIQPLEDRKLLDATVWVNDNWVNLTSPGNPPVFSDEVSNSSDTINPGGVVKIYGVEAFGTDANGDGEFPRIADAITAVDTEGTVFLLEGTYVESDILLNRPVTLTGAGDTGAAKTLIIPEATSSKAAAANFAPGTHSGILIRSEKVTIEDLALDGNGNNGVLGTSLHYHQGISTLYDLQDGLDYSSLNNGPQSRASFPASPTATDIRIENVTVENTWYRGITVSGLSGKTIAGVDVIDATVSNVGASGSQDVNRIGILLQNVFDGQVVNSSVTAAGTGIATKTFGTTTFGQSVAARNRTGLIGNTVTDAVVRGYSIENADAQLDANSARFLGFDRNLADFNSSNTAVGIYLDHSEPVIIGSTVDGAKIGVQVLNSLAGSYRPPMLMATTITGPGTGTSGSVGILAENTSSPTNSVRFVVGSGTSVGGFETGLKIGQSVTPADSQASIVEFDRATLSGNTTAISYGNGALVTGAVRTSSPVVSTGAGSLSPGFRVSSTVFNGTSPAVPAGPDSDTIGTGNLTLSAASSFAPLISGHSGTTSLFNFNSAATYSLSVSPPQIASGSTDKPYGATSITSGAFTQSGGGQLEIGIGSAVTNNRPTFAYGVRSHVDPNNPSLFIADPIDISNRTTLNVVAKAGASNSAEVFLFGLVDIKGNSAQWLFPFANLNTSTYTTLSVNLLAPSIPIFGTSSLDLKNIVGYIVGSDQTLVEDSNTPFALILDDVYAGSITNSQLDVTGTVTLANAKFRPTMTAGLTPTVGQQFTIINNDSSDAVSGTFAGLPQGSNLSINGQNFTISYTGGSGNDVVLTRSATTTPSSVAARHIFYNQSTFDGNNSTINSSDDSAIAIDKTPYLPGTGIASYANMTSYTRGINGIMVDLAGSHGTITASDFTFTVGANNTPSTWSAAPSPSAVTVRSGAGVSGSDRIEIIWSSGSMKDTWLRVIMAANANTGLAAPDEFYWADKVADYGSGSPVAFVTNSTDEVAAQNNTGAGASITNLYDYDRNGFVLAADATAARNNTGTLTRINIHAPPAAPEVDPLVQTATDNDVPVTKVPSYVPPWLQTRLGSAGEDLLNTAGLASAWSPWRPDLWAALPDNSFVEIDEEVLTSLVAHSVHKRMMRSSLR